MSKFKNFELAGMVAALEPLLSRNDILGYLAARNTKIINESLAEFNDFKETLIEKYGEPDKDEDGKDLGTISIYPGYEHFNEYVKEMAEIGNVEQEVNLITTSYDKALDKLTGQEILDLDWMFED